MDSGRMFQRSPFARPSPTASQPIETPQRRSRPAIASLATCSRRGYHARSSLLAGPYRTARQRKTDACLPHGPDRHCRFAVRSSPYWRSQTPLLCVSSRRRAIGMNLNGFFPPPLAGPAREKGLLTMGANAVDVADYAPCLCKRSRQARRSSQ